MKKYRIFLILGGKATPSDNSNIWVKNLYDPLVELGHDVFLLDIDVYAARHNLEYMSKEAKESLSNDLPQIFMSEHKKKKFDIFFSYLHKHQIEPDVFKIIKKSVFTINYTTNFHQFELYKEIASIVDYSIYISKIAETGFKEVTSNYSWMPLAGNPNFYKPSKSRNNQVVFIGSNYGGRPMLFWRLLQYGINFHLYGYGWKLNEENDPSSNKKLRHWIKDNLGYEIKKAPKFPLLQPSTQDMIRKDYYNLCSNISKSINQDFPTNVHSQLSDLEYVKVLSEADIVVNIQESRFNHDFVNHNVLFGSNLRDFEATMCGSFLCTQYSEEIIELFDIDKDIICYHNEHDLAEKIKYYTSNPEAKRKIELSGYHKSMSNHTWKNRFDDFFSKLNL